MTRQGLKTRQPQQKRSLEKKERILKSAAKLFEKHGFDEVAVNRIAREAGVSVGTFYAYYQDKRDVFISVMQEFSRRLHECLHKTVIEVKNEDLSLEQAVRKVIKNHRQSHEKEKGLHQEILIQSLKDEEIKRLHFRDEHRIINEVKELLADYPNTVEFEDPEAAMFVFVHTVDELVHYLAFFGSSIDEDKIINELTTMVVRYIRGGERTSK